MILVIKGIFTYFLVAPLGIGVSNSNGGKNEAVALVPIPIIEKCLINVKAIFENTSDN